jgi:hypothetical protein
MLGKIMHKNKEVIEAFIDQAERYGRAINDGDSKVANLSHDKLKAIIKATDSKEQGGILLKLCEHKSESVRLWAASFLLKQNESLSLSIIEEIISSGSILGLVAEVTLDKWKSGNFNE